MTPRFTDTSLTRFNYHQIGVSGIWFPFRIGVSRTQYVYAIAIPLLAFLIMRTLLFKQNASIERRRSVVPVAT